MPGFFATLLKFLTSGPASKKQGRAQTIDREMVSLKWEEISGMIKTGGASKLRSAVIESDKLLDYALKLKGFQGQTMGERLKNARGGMGREAYDAAWQCHKLRNRLVHEIEADLLHWEVKEAVDNFKKALKDLGAL